MSTNKTNKTNERLEALMELLEKLLEAKDVRPARAEKGKAKAKAKAKTKAKTENISAPCFEGVATLSGRFVWLSFPAVPSEKTRMMLKARGARFSRKRGMWYIACHIPDTAIQVFNDLTGRQI